MIGAVDVWELFLIFAVIGVYLIYRIVKRKRTD
jgi:hypothetical protein